MCSVVFVGNRVSLVTDRSMYLKEYIGLGSIRVARTPPPAIAFQNHQATQASNSKKSEEDKSILPLCFFFFCA